MKKAVIGENRMRKLKRTQTHVSGVVRYDEDLNAGRKICIQKTQPDAELWIQYSTNIFNFYDISGLRVQASKFVCLLHEQVGC